MSSHLTAFVIYIIKTFGYAGIGAIVFAESGLMLGFILPGDSLVFVAGILASQGLFNLTALILFVFVTAAIGDSTGYFIGRKLGRKVFHKPNSFIFNQENLHRTEMFFAKYGKMTFIIQRFFPIIRAFSPLLGGVGKMRYATFLAFDLVGCFLWALVVSLVGYYFGATIPHADSYLFPIAVIVVILSLIPPFVLHRQHRKRRNNEKNHPQQEVQQEVHPEAE